MRALALFVLVALTAEAATPPGRFQRTNRRCVGGRSDRGLSCDDYAFFEFAPASGAGMGAACACTTPTGAKGEALTFTRGSSGTCTKTTTGGLATTGIANGDLVTCTTDQPRVEYDGAGTLGLLVESARTNVLLRSDALTNAAWADVGTPSATDGATDPFGGTTGDTLTDNDAVAFEGRSQSVTVTAATAYVMSCYLKGTTSAKARLSLDGTTCDVSTLATTTWNLVTCADASSSGVSISAQVLVGNAVGDTGAIVVGGCQVEAGTYATSYSRTDAAAANRLAESASLATTFPAGGTYSVAGTFATGYDIGSSLNRIVTMIQDGSHFTDDYFPTRWTTFVFDGAADSKTHSAAVTTSGRVGGYYDLTNLAACVNGACETVAATVTWLASSTTVRLGCDGAGCSTGHPNGVISRVCVDPSPQRCR